MEQLCERAVQIIRENGESTGKTRRRAYAS